jgi:hypothetical protein
MPERTNRMFYLLATISLLLVLLIAAGGVRKRLDAIVPNFYRHTASLAIAIFEAAHGTSDLVGLVEVADALDKSGYDINPNRELISVLNTHPDQADAALRAAADLAIADRGKTFGLALNETGMIDYYYFAFKLFSYHVIVLWALYRHSRRHGAVLYRVVPPALRYSSCHPSCISCCC